MLLHHTEPETPSVLNISEMCTCRFSEMFLILCLSLTVVHLISTCKPPFNSARSMFSPVACCVTCCQTDSLIVKYWYGGTSPARRASKIIFRGLMWYVCMRIYTKTMMQRHCNLRYFRLVEQSPVLGADRLYWREQKLHFYCQSCFKWIISPGKKVGS